MNVYTEHQATYGPTWDAVNAPLICASAVSWSAIAAGAATTVAVSLILLMLGAGLAMASAIPWAPDAAGARALGSPVIVWVIATSLIASATGGYIAGRMRTKWIAVPNKEIHFRDTTHGFLAWAVASLATAVLLTSMVDRIIDADMPAAEAARAVDAGDRASGHDLIDTLFPIDRVTAIALPVGTSPAALAATGAEAARAQSRQHASRAVLWLVISLLIGSFAASLAATFGGRQRDA